MSWSNVTRAPKKRKRLNRYFAHVDELSRPLEESTSAVTGDTITAANEDKPKAKVVICRFHAMFKHYYRAHTLVISSFLHGPVELGTEP
jgi:transposase